MDYCDQRLSGRGINPLSLVALCLLMLGMGGAPVLAEEDSLAIEEVIVTARKIEESSQDVPIAITALSEELKRSTIRDLADLNGYAPNVRIGTDAQRSGAASIIIRGISPTRTDDNSFDSPIGVMIDGIYLGALAGQRLENFDIERVEVLRGPQGTLFGKNTVGGVIHAIRSRPTGEFGGRFKVTLGENKQQEVRAVINTSLSDEVLAAKFFFTSIQDDGYIKNTFTGNNMPTTDYRNYGVTFLATPSDSFEALLTVEKFEDDSQGGAFLSNYNTPDLLACISMQILPDPCRTDTNDVPDTISTNIENPSSLEVDAQTLKISLDLTDNVRLVSVTGFRDMAEDRKYDFDGSAGDFINIDRRNRYDQFSEEFRLEGSWDKITLVAGLYYWESEFEQDWVTGGNFWDVVLGGAGLDFATNTAAPVNPAAPIPAQAFQGLLMAARAPGSPLASLEPLLAQLSAIPGLTYGEFGTMLPMIPGVTVETLFPQLPPLDLCYAGFLGNIQCESDPSHANGLGDKYVQVLYETQETRSIAAFAQVEWEFAADWSLTAGLRWTRETKDFLAGQAYLTSSPRALLRNFPAYADLEDTWTELSPKAGISYRVNDDILLYASYSEGFHSGGFFGVNQNIADFTRDLYDPELSTQYEAGMKAQFWDNRIQLNATLFVNNFEDKQEQAIDFDPSTMTVATVFRSVDEATYQGAELEFKWRATEYLSLFANYGYLDAEYDKFTTDIDPSDNVILGMSVLEDATHLTPRNAPDFTYGVGGQLNFQVGGGELEFYIKYNKVGEVETNLLNQAGQLDETPDLSASLGYYHSNFSVVLYGRNLTDERVEAPVIIAPLFAVGNLNQGQTWGLDFTFGL